MINRVVALHYSPRGGTATITEQFASELADNLSRESGYEFSCEMYDILRHPASLPEFDQDTIVVIGMPARIGKLPVPALSMLKLLKGSGAMAVTLVSYGTRSYGNALYELYHFARESKFKVVGAGAFIAKHSGIKDYTIVRPDLQDFEIINEFAYAAGAKLRRLSGSQIESLRIKPAPMDICGKVPVHRISKISPEAAAFVENTMERICVGKRSCEWYL